MRKTFNLVEQTNWFVACSFLCYTVFGLSGARCCLYLFFIRSSVLWLDLYSRVVFVVGPLSMLEYFVCVSIVILFRSIVYD